MAREMKDSRVAWLGVIPANWNFGRVKHYYTVQKSIVGESADEYERLALTLNGVIKRSKEDSTGLQPDAFNGYQVLRQGELVFKLIDLENVSTSRVGLSPYTGIVSPAYIVLKSNGTMDSKFGYYYFISLWQREIFNRLGDDGVRSSLNANDLLNLPCLFPPPDEQNQIVDYLDSKCSEIDTVLKKTRTSIEEYKKLKQAIITQAVTKGVRGDRPMKESGIEWMGSCPANWTIIKIKWLLEEVRDRSTEGTEEPLSMSQKYGILPTRKMDIIPNMASSFVGAKLVRKGNLVFNKLKAHLGVFAVSGYDGLVSPDYAVYRTTNLVNATFLEYLFKTPQYISEFKKKSTGVAAGLTRLYTDELYSIFCALPSLEEQQEIIRYLQGRIATIDFLIQKKEQFVTELETYKKSLIYEYVTGKKEVQQKQQVKEMVVHPFFPAIFQATNPRFAQAILMSKVLDSCRVKMGRVKLEKMMFVLENSIGFDFDTEYVREAAGPLDKSIYACEQIISKKNKWFAIRQSSYGVSYHPTKDAIKYKEYYDRYFAGYANEIDRIINIFRNFNTDQAEIIATLYGAWNDFIIDKESYTDDDIVEEVLNNWNDTKKRFSKDVWLRAIQRMREFDIVPHGYGRHTVIKQN